VADAVTGAGAFVPPPASVAWLAVVCTDHRTHKRTRLCDVRFREDGTWHATECGSQSDDEGYVRSWEVMSPEDAPDQWVYEFHCRRCGRNSRIARENWLKAIDAFHPRTWPVGVSERHLDLSLLPF
jgi:hypothetical protein